MWRVIWNVIFKLLYLLPCRPFKLILKFPSASVNPTNQLMKSLSKLMDFLFDSKVRIEFFFTLIWLQKSINNINRLVGTNVNPWTNLLS